MNFYADNNPLQSIEDNLPPVINKNIRIISKKPLIAHTIISAINSKLFSHVVVSTEDKKIAQISKKYGAEVPFLRPKNLALDTTPVGDVFIHAIKKLYSLGTRNLLIEGGDVITKNLIKNRLIDKFYLFKSPKIMKTNKEHKFFTSLNILNSRYRKKNKINSKIGKDTITIYKR